MIVLIFFIALHEETSLTSDSSEWFVWLALLTKEVLVVTITHISQIGGVMMIQHDWDSDSDSIHWIAILNAGRSWLNHLSLLGFSLIPTIDNLILRDFHFKQEGMYEAVVQMAGSTCSQWLQYNSKQKMQTLQNWTWIGKKLPVLSVNYQAKEA